MFVEQIVDLIGRAVRRNLVRLFGFTVERRLIHLEFAVKDFAVGGNLVARLEIDHVAHHDFAHMDFFEPAIADHFCRFLGFFFGFERGRLAFLRVFAEGRDAVGNENRHENADRLKPFRLAEEIQNHLHHQRDHENEDHGVLEPFENLFPERIGGNLGELIGAVFLAAFFDFLRR